MTRQNVPLHGLRALTTAFLLARIAEGKDYCANQDNKVVEFDLCAGNTGQSANTFFLFSSEDPNIPVGTTIDPSQTDLRDSSDPVERRNVLLTFDMESGGFGKRSCEGDGCENNGGRPIGG